MNNTAGILIIGLIMTLMSYVVVETWAATPQVYKSNITRECVKVVPDTAGTCDSLPDRYDVVWVK